MSEGTSRIRDLDLCESPRKTGTACPVASTAQVAEDGFSRSMPSTACGSDGGDCDSGPIQSTEPEPEAAVQRSSILSDRPSPGSPPWSTGSPTLKCMDLNGVESTAANKQQPSVHDDSSTAGSFAGEADARAMKAREVDSSCARDDAAPHHPALASCPVSATARCDEQGWKTPSPTLKCVDLEDLEAPAPKSHPVGNAAPAKSHAVGNAAAVVPHTPEQEGIPQRKTDYGDTLAKIRQWVRKGPKMDKELGGELDDASGLRTIDGCVVRSATESVRAPSEEAVPLPSSRCWGVPTASSASSTSLSPCPESTSRAAAPDTRASGEAIEMESKPKCVVPKLNLPGTGTQALQPTEKEVQLTPSDDEGSTMSSTFNSVYKEDRASMGYIPSTEDALARAESFFANFGK
eukprot:gnl/TRDRNA2_/TRDRNA2_78526_c0_seq1.p1 gnl/TRDRNA2_/TRDRNA2_78526_c0~~gnl/TRDRNA2_/TRDRNA2_78526_c0_seq1.p1  ORF type:complete len:405 (-),score=68.80 gnl/TRDRNA2_/TRDRNA2_78526_c0_seq1:111-1325(-)